MYSGTYITEQSAPGRGSCIKLRRRGGRSSWRRRCHPRSSSRPETWAEATEKSYSRHRTRWRAYETQTCLQWFLGNINPIKETGGQQQSFSASSPICLRSGATRPPRPPQAIESTKNAIFLHLLSSARAFAWRRWLRRREPRLERHIPWHAVLVQQWRQARVTLTFSFQIGK